MAFLSLFCTGREERKNAMVSIHTSMKNEKRGNEFMKKLKKGLAVLLAGVMCVLAVPNTTKGDVCTHPKVSSRVVAVYNLGKAGSHMIPTGYYVGDTPIYQQCIITVQQTVTQYYCNRCGAVMTTTTSNKYVHSVSH